MDRRVALGRYPARRAGPRPLAPVARRLDAAGGRTRPLRRAGAGLVSLTRGRLASLTASPSFDGSLADVLDRGTAAGVNGERPADHLLGGRLRTASPLTRPPMSAAAPRGPTVPRDALAAVPTRRDDATRTRELGSQRPENRQPSTRAGGPPASQEMARERLRAASEVRGLEWMSARVPGGGEAAGTPLSKTTVVNGHRTAGARDTSNEDPESLGQMLTPVPALGGQPPEAVGPGTMPAPATPAPAAPAPSVAPAAAARASRSLPPASGDPQAPNTVSTPPLGSRSTLTGGSHEVSGQLAALVRSWDAAEPQVPAARVGRRPTGPSRTRAPASPSSWGEPGWIQLPRHRGPTAIVAARGDELLAAAVGRVLASELRRYGIEVDEP